MVPLMIRRVHKWMLLVLLPCLWLGGTALRPAPHPFYISVTEINHNAADKSLEISCKVFVDDLEEVLKRNYHTPVDLSNGQQQERSGGYVDKYIRQHLQLRVNGKPVALKFIGFEKESEAVFCYFEGQAVPAVKQLEVENAILQDFTSEQVNIMHVTVGGRRQSTKLNFPAKQASFQF